MEPVGMPCCSVNSVRILLHRPRSRLQLIFRRNGEGKLGLIGGKIGHLEHPKVALLRELDEEGRFQAVMRLWMRTALTMPNRVISYPVAKLQQLGYDTSKLFIGAAASIPGGFSLGNDVAAAGAGEPEVLVANPFSLVFSGVTEEALPAEKIEDCEIVEVCLNKEKVLRQIKARYRPVVSAWRQLVLNEVPMPRLIHFSAPA